MEDITRFLMGKYGDNWHEQYNAFVEWAAEQLQGGQGGSVILSPEKPPGDNWAVWLEDLGEVDDPT